MIACISCGDFLRAAAHFHDRLGKAPREEVGHEERGEEARGHEEPGTCERRINRFTWLLDSRITA